MQGFKPLHELKRRDDKHAVANLLESAKGMLKNGETPDVVTFAQATLDEILASVLPAIRDASAAEQVQLDAVFALFERALQALQEGNEEIHQLNQDERAISTQHKTCRDVEDTKCHEKVDCDYHLYDLWHGFIDAESDIRSLERRIDGHFCAVDPNVPLGSVGHWTANGTQMVFRREAEEVTHGFARLWGIVRDGEEAYDTHVPICEERFRGLDQQTAQCDSRQNSLEMTACQHATEINRVRSEFNCAWQNAVISYTETEAHVRIMEIDRIREWRHLSTVECLLARTTERNGRPCEESTDEATEEIAHCEAEWRTEQVTNEIAEWLITFPCEMRVCGVDGSIGIGPHLNDDGSTNPGCSGPLVCPAFPPDCADRDHVVGRCYPKDIETPCSAGFIAQEYSGLPLVPQADFHNENSHCNQRPDCQMCNLPEIQDCSLVLPPVTVAPVTAAPEPVTTTAAPAPQCGPLPALTNAVWTESGDSLLYQCEEGFSFHLSPAIREVECLPDGTHSPVRICLPIDDCMGHTCGAFGSCSDLHMDYTCQCLDGYEINELEGGEKICGNVDDCQGHTCGEAGICVDGVEDYTCNCDEGWEQVVMADNSKQCDRKECGEVPEVANLALTPWNGGKAVFQDVIQYNCASGYSTTGTLEGDIAFSVNCQASATFTDVSECLPISCGAPEPAGSATPVSTDSLHFGQAVEYQCPVGYGPDSYGRTCESNGQLSPPMACEPRLCGSQPRFVMSTTTSASSFYFFGQTAEYSCNAGYSTDTSNPEARAFSVECLATGWETGVTGCLPVTCDFQPDETHYASAASTLHYGDINMVSCAEGHTGDGTAWGLTEMFVTCDAQGNHDAQSCRPVTCAASNLHIALHAQTDVRDIQLGESATYTCDTGFAVADTSAATFEVRCLRDGSFSAMSTCRNIDDCVGHSCGSNGRCVDGISDYSCACEDGFEETQSDSGEKQCGNINDCGPSQCGSNGMCHDLTNGFQCECDSGYEVRDGDSANSDRVCLPVACPIPSMDGVVAGATSLLFPQSLFIECTEGFTTAVSEDSSFQVDCAADGQLTSPARGLEYVGCYVDDGSRDLQDGPMRYGYTSETCYAACSGYNYFALQNNGWCVCGNAYGTESQYRSVGDNECGGNCAGDDQLCGAGWRNAVYSTGLSASSASQVLPQCTAVSCGQAPAVAHAVDLPTQGAAHIFTFNEVAQYRCQGGEVEITYQCQANGQFSVTSQFSTCQNTCGAPSIPDHAHRVDGVGDVVHPMSASWACEPGFTHLAGGVAPGRQVEPATELQYIGCYVDDGNRDLQDGPRQYGYTSDTCNIACSAYTYFALQNNGWCVCSNAYSSESQYRHVGDNECGSNCVGDDQRCGAGWRNAVFSTGQASRVESTYLGCYVDDGSRDLRQGPRVYGHTSSTCNEACSGFSFFSLQNNGWCACDNAYGSAAQYVRVADSQCGNNCAGDDQLCGAGWRNAVYSRTSQTSMTQVCQANGVFDSAGTECVPVTCQRPNLPANWAYTDDAAFTAQSVARLRCADGYQSTSGQSGAASQVEFTCNADGEHSAQISVPLQYIGCHVDDGNRDLQDGPRQYGYTSDTCDTACQGWSFFALQNNGWCVCSNAYASEPQYSRVGDNECGNNCAGDDQLCGAGWRNAVFRVSTPSALPEPCEVATHQLSGRITSAIQVSQGLSGVQMVAGSVSATSDGSGHYQINLAAGQHSFTLSRDGFIMFEGTVTVSQNTGGYDLSMSPLLSHDSYRVVLTWGSSPRDLDSHLQFGGNACPEVFYGRTSNNCGGVTASLDVDDTSSYGPETITLSNLNSCSDSWWGASRCSKWTYKVKNYSANYDNNNGWAESQGEVKLYNGDHLVATYTVGNVGNGGHGHTTSNGNGRDSNAFWNVFSIDGSGNVATCTDRKSVV